MKLNIILRFLFVISLFNACFLNLGGGTGYAQTQVQNKPEDVRLETISPFDTLKISIYPQEELDNDFSVDSEGNLNYLFLGKISVKGLTTESLAKKLTVLLNEYLIEPQVTIKIVEKGVTLTNVTVLGEVKLPGSLYIGTKGVSLMDIINRAKGFTEFANLENIEVLRYGEVDTEGRRQERKIILNAKTMVEGKESNILINPGDTVTVPRKEIKVSVIGEVNSPKRLDYKPGMMLMQAVTEAGGIKDKSYTNIAEIVRQEGDTIVTMKKDLRNILNGSEHDFLLQPDDIVNVGSTNKGQVLVMGEVKQPQSMALSNGMTLMQVISQAGGFGQYANMNKITLTRKMEKGSKKMTFKAKDILDGRREDPIVEAGDVIFVAESAI